MENSFPSSSLPDDDKGPYRCSTAAGKQSLRSTSFEFKQPRSFWSVLAKKAKSVLLDDDSSVLQSEHTKASPSVETEQQHSEASILQRRLSALTSSLSSLGGTIGNAIEESLNKMEAKASDLISSKKLSDSAKANLSQDLTRNSCHEHSKIPSLLGHKGSLGRAFSQSQSCVESTKLGNVQNLSASSFQHKFSVSRSSQEQPSNAKSLHKEDSVLRSLQRNSDDSTADTETQLKASRDVAMAMAAKAKLLLRELKEAKADLAAAREYCTQLEEENRRIRASIGSGSKPDEEDLVRIQLETLLAEKARLAQENAYFARENQFLREMIEYHRLTMQSEGTLLEEDGSGSDCNFNIDDLPPETIISTIIS